MYSNNNPACFRRTRMLLVAAAVALVLLCAVFVGGVSGATHYVYANDNLADIVDNNANDGDEIVITGDYVISEQVVLSRNYDITITNAPGVDVTISGNADAGSLFKIGGGTLTVKGNDDGGSLTITTNLNGRAFDVNYGAALNIYDGVIVYQCGFDSANADDYNGGAVSVDSGGNFIMYGGLLLDNTGYKGGAVYVDSGGYFELKEGKGIITNNHALYSSGGGVWAENSDNVKWTGGDIKGNTASSKCNDNLNNIYPYVACPETEAPIRVGSGNTPIISNCDECWSISEAYDKMNKKDIKEFTIYICRNFTQGYIETWNGNSYTTKLDYVYIEEDFGVYLKPSSKDSINLNIIDQMFSVSGDYFIIAPYTNSGAPLTVSGKNEVNNQRNGGFIYINGGLSHSIKCSISDTKANNGGAIYIESGSCTLPLGTSINGCTSSDDGGAVYIKSGNCAINDVSINGCTSSDDGGAIYVEGGTLSLWDSSINGCVSSGDGGAVYVNGGTLTLRGTSSSMTTKITDCTSSGKGGAVYFADGTFNVMGSATVDSSNDVYLSAGQVITAAKGYWGTIGKITLPSYEEGTKVVNVNTDSTGYPNKFILNQDGNDGIERILVLEEGSTNYLVLKNDITYLVTIPERLPISSEGTGTMSISVSNLKIPSTSAVKVYVSGDFELEYAEGGTSVPSLSYELTSGEGILTNDAFVGQFTMSAHNPLQITATVLEPASYAGTYSDTVTFTYGLEMTA